MTDLASGIRLTALYVPGSRPERFDKAVASGADVVIIDLEDAVAPEDKPAARAAVEQWYGNAAPTVPVQLRINAFGTPWFDEDVALASRLRGVDVRVPKVEGAEAIPRLPGTLVCALIETALGLERAFDIAGIPEVSSIALGESDLAGDLGSSSPAVLDWARIRLVVAARAAGLSAPMMSVYPSIADLGGLEADTVRGAGLGMIGRSAVHPAQLAPIVRAFRPTAEQLAWAGEVEAALAAKGGATRLSTGAMVDAAMAAAAARILALAAAARSKSNETVTETI